MDRTGGQAILSIGETPGAAPGDRFARSSPQGWSARTPSGCSSGRFRLYGGRGYQAGGTPNAVTALCGLLTDPAAPPCGTTATASDPSTRWLSQLDDLLDLERLQTGAARLDRSAFQLEPLLRQMDKALGLRRKGVALRCHVRAPAKQPLRGDRARLARLLSNLMAYALRTGSPRSLDVVADYAGTALTIGLCAIGKAGEEDSPCVAVYWTDARSLADEDDRRQIGLELAIAQSLTLLMHGTLAVEQRSGGTVNASLRLPLERA